MFQLFIGIVALAALLSFINIRFIKLPDTIGVMLLSILASLVFGLIYFFHPHSVINACQIFQQIDFKAILLDFLLGILLFAGAIHVNLKGLIQQKKAIIVYATFGVLISTFLIGTLFYALTWVLGLEISYLYSLVFGALVSPTDPVAVLALLKKAGAPKHIELKIVGESLFNDGVGIVIFLSLLSLATMASEFSLIHIGREFLLEAGGGFLMGILLGYMGRWLIRQTTNHPAIAVHISLSIVLGGYTLASLLHVSGAIAMVVAGLVIGHSLHKEVITKDIRDHMNIFWKVLDEIFNAVLFVLIGLEIILINFETNYVLISVVCIGVVIIARYCSVYISNLLMDKRHRAKKKERKLLTWAGLRGGISIALALTLPQNEVRDLILFSTYVVVVFSILVQGLTIERFTHKLYNKS